MPDQPGLSMPTPAPKRSSMSIGYGPHAARSSASHATLNFGARAMSHALGCARDPQHTPSPVAVPAPSLAPAPVPSPSIDGCYLTRPPSASNGLEQERACLDPIQVLRASVGRAFHRAHSPAAAPLDHPACSPAALLPPPSTPSLLHGSDGSSGDSSMGEASSPSSHFALPVTVPLPIPPHQPAPTRFVDPATFQPLAFPSLQPADALQAAKAAQMLASAPSWETYAHLTGAGLSAPITAHPSQLIRPTPVPAIETKAGSKRKRASTSSEQKAVTAPLSKRAPSPSSSHPSSSLGEGPERDLERHTFGAAQWVPPAFAPRQVDWDAAQRAVASGKLPQKLLNLLRECQWQGTSKESRGRATVGERTWVGTRPGTQPHLDKLREEVLSGQRPDLVAMYVGKLRPKPASRSDPLLAPARLSKAEKRQNHLASEQKRRTNIRRGYQDLAALLPSLQHYDRDDIKVGMAMESQFLRKAIDRMRDLAETHATLIAKRDQTIHLLGSTYDVDLLLPCPSAPASGSV